MTDIYVVKPDTAFAETLSKEQLESIEAGQGPSAAFKTLFGKLMESLKPGAVENEWGLSVIEGLARDPSEYARKMAAGLLEEVRAVDTNRSVDLTLTLASDPVTDVAIEAVGFAEYVLSKAESDATLQPSHLQKLGNAILINDLAS